MSTQTGSISFEATGGFNSYAKQNYATLSQIKGQFATCGTGASTAAKVATIVPTDSGWTLYDGATITVKFTSKNTISAPTLNVNGTGAKPIKDFNGNNLTQAAYEWPEGAAMSFTYDGTYWRIQDSNLMERVHTAETAIEQNANEINLRATKEEVNNAIDDVKITKSGEGASVLVEDSAGLPPIEVTSEGWSEQASTTGKNLKKPTVRTATASGMTYSVAEDGKITLSGTATQADNFTIYLGQTFDAGTYTASFHGSDKAVFVGDSSVRTVTDPTVSSFYIRVKDGTTYNESFYVQLEAGSTATDYEPYTGGKPSPSPDYPQEVKVARGRNLLPKMASQTISGVTATVADDGEITLNGTATATMFFLTPCDIKTGIFTLSANNPNSSSTANLIFKLIDGQGVDIPGASKQINAANTIESITTAVEAKTWVIRVASGASFSNFKLKPQLEYGSTPMPYVPYGHVGLEVRDSSDELVSVTPIPLPEKGFAAALPDGTADSLAIDSAGRCEWESVSGIHVLDGSEKWNWGSSVYDGSIATDRYTLALNGMSRDNVYATGMSTHFMLIANRSIWSEPDRRAGYYTLNNNQFHAVFPNGVVGIAESDDGDTRTSAIKAWLAANPVTVLYPLATPTAEHGYIDLPTIPEGATITIPELAKSGIKISWWTESGQEAGNAHYSSVKENAELRIAADGITSEVSKISSAKYATTGYNYTLAQIKTYAAENHSDSWTIANDNSIRVGDTVYVKVQDTTRTCPVYIKVKVTKVNSATSIIGTSHGYEDVLPVDTIKSTINQSADSVKIAANHVDIEGAAIFSSGGAYDKSTTIVKSETQWYSSTSATSKSGGSWGTTQPTVTAGRYIWQRELITYANGTTAYKPNEAGVCIQGQTDLSSYSTTTQMNTALAGKADTSLAVSRTQRIYYQSASTIKPATPGTTSSDWVSDESGAADKWTLKRMSYSSAKPYIYTCEQKQVVSGTVSYTPVLLDDTTTVIDGGKIITGSVQANAIKADSGTFNTANIPNLSAAKITSGDIAADRIKTNVVNAINATVNQIDAKNIKASELQIGQSQVTNLTNDIADAKKHTQVIVSASNVNYVANTCTLTARLYIDGVLQTGTSLKWQWYRDGTAQGSQMTGATGTLDVTSTLGIGHRYSCKCTF